MVGITSCGAYIPYWRLDKSAISGDAKGEKPICCHDEDSITMAVASVMDCLGGAERKSIDGLYFASTTAPYREKSSAATVAMAADLSRDIFTADFGSSLRAGTSALRAALDSVAAGTAENVIVVGADCRIGYPGSPMEMIFGDGAGALMVGDQDVIASIEEVYSVSEDIFDQWRTAGDIFVRSWEERFCTTEGYLPLISEAVSVLLNRCKLTPKNINKAIFCSPDGKKHAKVAAEFGFDLKSQVISSFSEDTCNTGTALPLMALVAALEQSKKGDKILLVTYGDGSDAFLLEVQNPIKQCSSKRGIRGCLSSKKVISDYRSYLFWRGLLPTDRRLETVSFVSVPAIHRAQGSNLRMLGCKCQNCDTIQFPIQRICTKCHAKDKFTPYRLSDKRAKVFTYTGDYISNPLIEKPIVTNTIDFEGGGRMQCYMTDCDIEKIHPGLPVEMTFRKMNYRDGIYSYGWKSMPVRA